MEIVLLLVLAIFSSILFNYGYPKVLASPRSAKLQTSYAGKTALTAVTFFVVIVAASLLMSAVGEKPSLPSA